MAVALVVAALLASACSGDDRDEAREAAAAFLAAWSSGDLAGAAALTDNPEAAEEALTELKDRLIVTKAALAAGDKTEDGDDEATVAFTADLELRDLGRWRYDSAVTVTKNVTTDAATDTAKDTAKDTGRDAATDASDEGERGWRVRWAPTIIHPGLSTDTRLRRVRELPDRASILDRAGQPLTINRPVVTVGVWPAKLTDPEQTYAVIGPALGVDTDKLANRVKQAEPDHFVPVITLREPDYEQVREEISELPGLTFRESTRSLAPTADFARAVLGTVGPATEETLENAGEWASPADTVGRDGLQFVYQKRLAGKPGGRVEIVERGSERVVAAVHEFMPEPGEPVRTTIDPKVQEAAEEALEGIETPSALVAIEPGTGEVLAAANGPAGAAYNRAFVGRYPPGSTFKVVTAAALLSAGELTPDEEVDCPRTVTVRGKRFENQNEFALGKVPFTTAFARSCNTAMVALRSRLDDPALTEQAEAFGIGAEWQVGLPAESGNVPPPGNDVEKAASTIGQSKLAISPLGMAAVAATVQAGQFRQPVLIPEPAPTRYQPERRLSPAVAEQLRALMRTVVTDGSGRALRDLPGEPAAKTGTAEYGTERPPRTHAWMIGFHGELAFSVLIEDGGSGGGDAGPVAARFLSTL